MTGTLFLVSTPIGNLADLSRRAAETLTAVDFIAAEDTRVTVKLLNHLGIKKPQMSYHRHKLEEGGQTILQRLLSGESCALVSDAGTPAISDPGEALVALCAAHQVPVVPVPGPAALIAALSASGLPTGRFCFEGFLPMNRKNRRAQLALLEGEFRTMIFYEAPHKLAATLEDLAAVFGGARRIALCRELTKRHEEIWRGTLEDAILWQQSRKPPGEFVLVLEGLPLRPEPPKLDLDAVLHEVQLLREGGASLQDACRAVAKESGCSRKALYDAALRRQRDAQAIV